MNKLILVGHLTAFGEPNERQNTTRHSPSFYKPRVMRHEESTGGLIGVYVHRRVELRKRWKELTNRVFQPRAIAVQFLSCQIQDKHVVRSVLQHSTIFPSQTE